MKRNNGRNIYCEENARGISKEKKSYMCFVDIEKKFNKNSKKGDRVGHKKGLPEVMVRGVTSLHDGEKDKTESGICV